MADGEIIDLCAGYGGLSMGLAAVTGAQVTAYAEIEPAALSILKRHHPDAADLGDVKTLDWWRVAGARWFCAGYPCQPFADPGRKLGAADPRHIWPWIARGIDIARPDFVLLENVRGHVKRGLREVLANLVALGYGGAWTVVRASDVGAPHQRARVFVLAGRHVVPEFVEVNGPGRAELANRHRLLPTLEAKLGSSGPDFARAERPNSGGDDLTTIAAKVARGMIGAERYAPALEHWARVLGRPAPGLAKPGADRVNPVFGEWMMGLPSGHVTGQGLSAEAELRALGNGVVPFQSSYAVEVLMDHLPVTVAPPCYIDAPTASQQRQEATMDNPTISWRITEATGNALAAGADIPGVVAAAFTALAEHHRERAKWLADNRKKGWKSTGEALVFAAEQLESAAGELENGETPQATSEGGPRCASFRRATADDDVICTLPRGHSGDHAQERDEDGRMVGVARWPRKHSGELCNVAMTQVDADVRCLRPLGHDGEHAAPDASLIEWTWTYGTEPVRHDPADDPNTAEDDMQAAAALAELDAAHAAYDAATDEMVTLGAHADCVYVDGVCTLAGGHSGTAAERAEDVPEEIHANQCASVAQGERCALTAQPPHSGNHIGTKGGRWPQDYLAPGEKPPPVPVTFGPEDTEPAETADLRPAPVVAVEHRAYTNSAPVVVTEIDPGSLSVTIGPDGTVTAAIPAQRTEETDSMDATNPFGPPQLAVYAPTTAPVPFRAPSIVVPLLPAAPVELREYDSVSSIESMAGCGMKYRLHYHENAPELPAWWLVGGKAFHRVVEQVEYDAARGTTTTEATAAEAWEGAFAHEIATTESDSDVPRRHWRSAKGTKASGPENGAWWAENGRAMSVRYLIGRRELVEDGWEILRNGAGDLALELGFKFPLGHFGRPIRGFIDSVWINRAKRLVLVVDDKSGARPPESKFQLETYAAAVAALLAGSDMADWPVLGTYYNARKGTYSDRVQVNTDAAAQIADARSAMTAAAERAGVFLPRMTNLCKGCGVAASCPVMALAPSIELRKAEGTDVEAPDWDAS